MNGRARQAAAPAPERNDQWRVLGPAGQRRQVVRLPVARQLGDQFGRHGHDPLAATLAEDVEPPLVTSVRVEPAREVPHFSGGDLGEAHALQVEEGGQPAAAGVVRLLHLGFLRELLDKAFDLIP